MNRVRSPRRAPSPYGAVAGHLVSNEDERGEFVEVFLLPLGGPSPLALTRAGREFYSRQLSRTA